MARRRDDDDEDDDDDDTPRRTRRGRDDDDDGDDPAKKPSRENAYTGLLAICLVALLGACAMFYLDAEELASQPLQAPSVTIPHLGDPPKAGPGPGTTPAAPGKGL